MTQDTLKNPVASVRQRLRNLAAERNEDFGYVLTQYALQRLLHRLSGSEFRERFLLKGATLFAIWSDQPHRPTRDLDLLGYGSSDVPAVEAIFRALLEAQTDGTDGLLFDGDSVTGGTIRDDQEYEGVRITLTARLGNARIPLQIDVGFGDDVFPVPTEAEVPGLLGFPAAKVRAYPREAVVAEKLHVMAVLGIANSRMKDYSDLWTLGRLFPFSGATLAESVARTFARRRTKIPTEIPLALAPDFASDKGKATQWTAFLRKGGVRDAAALTDVVSDLAAFLWPVLEAAAGGESFEASWAPGGPWRFPRGLD